MEGGGGESGRMAAGMSVRVYMQQALMFPSQLHVLGTMCVVPGPIYMTGSSINCVSDFQSETRGVVHHSSHLCVIYYCDSGKCKYTCTSMK